MKPGTIVRCRGRDWVLLPGDQDVYLLRPLAGTTDEVVAIHRRLSDLVGFSFPEERVTPSAFPPPTEWDVSDAASAQLLWHAARLTLREGAAPLRSLGKISIRPRAYQFVPLLMALRLDPVRLFIADDVGVGKTVEALLIARELWERGEIKRFCVLCPPYLCEHWERELRLKFNFQPVIIRSSTLGALERQVPPGKTIYEFFPVQVISIDWVKSDRKKHLFLQFCPELVIVDEVHGAAAAAGADKTRQERHQLLREVAQDKSRHLILLTATPHSGIEEAFQSLLGLLNPEFARWNPSNLTEPQRIELARHFVQRTRKDIQSQWQEQRCFPERQTADETYTLSPQYTQLFRLAYDFCRGIVQTGQQLEARKRRVRYWGALALLRCVMSSPAAAIATLAVHARLQALPEGDQEFSHYVVEPSEDRADDEIPGPVIEEADATLDRHERRQLLELARLAGKIHGTDADTKLTTATEIVRQLLRDGFNPIIWCRYIHTAEYVGKHLRSCLPGQVQVVTVTGRLGDDEREARIAELATDKPRVLVATDCLSEGINLQDRFNAVLHYDLPWNPNRLEQREGRVDRYGQTAPVVRAIRFYGRNNPVDGAVIEVLLNKAREIHRSLGTHVPAPQEPETVMEAVLNALFLRRKSADEPDQLRLFAAGELGPVAEFHRRWDLDAERERINRTRFAQRALKPEEVQRELEAADSVLGDPHAVREFVLAAAQRLGIRIEQHRCPSVYRIDVSQAALATVPEPVCLAISQHLSLAGRRAPQHWLISFDSPTPEGAEYLGRNHPFVTALARFLFEEALSKGDKATAARCGVIRTRAVRRLTSLMLLRVRYLIEQPDRVPLLAEEVLVTGYTSVGTGAPLWLADQEALGLLGSATPDANVPLPEKRELVRLVLGEIGPWPHTKLDVARATPVQRAAFDKIAQRAAALEQAHRRIRQSIGLRVRELKINPQLPPDLLGLFVLQPLPEV